MPKTLTPAMRAHLDEETTELAAIWRIPAHRGLVYITFDRLPLAEWNNRIPPITAEIAWSGERPATVRNATFLPHGGTSFQRSGMAMSLNSAGGRAPDTAD